MLQFTTIAEQRAWSRSQQRAGKTIAFVPTMGALHAGHISLMAQAKSAAEVVVASIFVNPTQFDNPEDLGAYPRTLAADLELLSAAGVDAVYLPTVGELYPDGYCTFVEMVGPLTDKLCAVARPGHFRGVCTVVLKLFGAVLPDIAIFGEKDLQQVLILSRMASDLNLPVEVRVGATLRDADGLAMSSRNTRLAPTARTKALGLPRGLEMANRAFKEGEHSSMKLIELVANELLVHEGVELDYCDVIKLAGFKEVENADDGCVLAAAAFVDGVRLIDHVYLGRDQLPVSVEA
jgi:pantoate--beta-alanine ligase